MDQPRWIQLHLILSLFLFSFLPFFSIGSFWTFFPFDCLMCRRMSYFFPFQDHQAPFDPHSAVRTLYVSTAYTLKRFSRVNTTSYKVHNLLSNLSSRLFLGCHGPESGNCALSHYTVAHDVSFAFEMGLNSKWCNIQYWTSNIHIPEK